MNLSHVTLIDLLIHCLCHQLTKVSDEEVQMFLKARISEFEVRSSKIKDENNYRLSNVEWKQAYHLAAHYHEAIEQEYRLADSYNSYHLAAIAQMKDELYELANE